MVAVVTVVAVVAMMPVMTTLARQGWSGGKSSQHGDGGYDQGDSLEAFHNKLLFRKFEHSLVGFTVGRIYLPSNARPVPMKATIAVSDCKQRVCKIFKAIAAL
jgi:hypothetical protein